MKKNRLLLLFVIVGVMFSFKQVNALNKTYRFGSYVHYSFGVEDEYGNDVYDLKFKIYDKGNNIVVNSYTYPYNPFYILNKYNYGSETTTNLFVFSEDEINEIENGIPDNSQYFTKEDLNRTFYSNVQDATSYYKYYPMILEETSDTSGVKIKKVIYAVVHVAYAENNVVIVEFRLENACNTGGATINGLGLGSLGYFLIDDVYFNKQLRMMRKQILEYDEDKVNKISMIEYIAEEPTTYLNRNYIYRREYFIYSRCY